MANIHDVLIESLKADEPVALCTVIAGPAAGAKLLVKGDGSTIGAITPPPLHEAVCQAAAELMQRQKTERRSFEAEGESFDVLIEIYPPSPRLLIVGAVHVAVPLISFARTLGFRTVVIDPRSAFATPDRFAHADELIVEWPEQVIRPADLNESTYVVALSHDPRLDNPVLKLALESRCRYIGALGSRKTHGKRLEALRAMGVPEEQIARIHAPIGLNLGAANPAEIAVSIIAQIVAVKNGQSA